MNPGLVGILFENLSIFIRRGVPVLLRLEGLRLKFVGLVGSGCDGSYFLGRARGELREVVRHDVEDFRVLWEVALEDPQCIDGCLLLVEAHGTTRCGHRGAILHLLVLQLRKRSLQYWKSLLAAPLDGQVDRTLKGGWSFLGGIFTGLGREGTGRKDRRKGNL